MAVQENQLLRLMTLLSPVFPIGGFAYSHGLEQAVHEGFISCRKDLEDWLMALMEHGSAHNDSIFLAQAWKQTKAGNNIDELNALACALSASREREMESCNQGHAFLKAQANIEYMQLTDLYDKKITYPIAVGLVAAKMELELVAVLNAYLHGFISNLIQAAIRLVPLGQNDGVYLMVKLEKNILKIAQNGHHMAIHQLGSCCLMADIMSMRHEHLYSRIFRS